MLLDDTQQLHRLDIHPFNTSYTNPPHFNKTSLSPYYHAYDPFHLVDMSNPFLLPFLSVPSIADLPSKMKHRSFMFSCLALKIHYSWADCIIVQWWWLGFQISNVPRVLENHILSLCVGSLADRKIAKRHIWNKRSRIIYPTSLQVLHIHRSLYYLCNLIQPLHESDLDRSLM